MQASSLNPPPPPRPRCQRLHLILRLIFLLRVGGSGLPAALRELVWDQSLHWKLKDFLTSVWVLIWPPWKFGWRRQFPPHGGRLDPAQVFVRSPWFCSAAPPRVSQGRALVGGGRGGRAGGGSGPEGGRSGPEGGQGSRDADLQICSDCKKMINSDPNNLYFTVRSASSKKCHCVCGGGVCVVVCV